MFNIQLLQQSYIKTHGENTPPAHLIDDPSVGEEFCCWPDTTGHGDVLERGKRIAHLEVDDGSTLQCWLVR